jgi:uncharacterized membrane protein
MYSDVLLPLALIETLQYVSLVLAAIIGFIGVLVMAYGALHSGTMFLLCVLHKKDHLPQIRIELGKHLALGLEFLVGKDIIETIVHPTWDDLGKLAAIVALRTVITVFLSWELKEVIHEVEEEQEMEDMIKRHQEHS